MYRFKNVEKATGKAAEELDRMCRSQYQKPAIACTEELDRLRLGLQQFAAGGVQVLWECHPAISSGVASYHLSGPLHAVATPCPFMQLLQRHERQN